MEYHVAYICDEQYALPTLVSAVSVKQSMPGVPVHAHIVTPGLSAESHEKARELSDSCFHVVIHETDMAQWRERLGKVTQRTHVTPTALLKFELPQILERLDRVLYLDSDIIVKRDLSALFEKDLTDAYASCAQELWKAIHKAGDGDDQLYFNSGVMLLNLDLMRRDNISEALWQEKLRAGENPNSKTMDQDTLNHVLGARIAPLDILYNLNPYFAQRRYLALLARYTKEAITSKSDLMEKARILHYVGKEDKPWIYENARMARYWDKCYAAIYGSTETLQRKRYKRTFKTTVELLGKYIRKYGFSDLLRNIKRRLMG